MARRRTSVLNPPRSASIGAPSTGRVASGVKSQRRISSSFMPPSREHGERALERGDDALVVEELLGDGDDVALTDAGGEHLAVVDELAHVGRAGRRGARRGRGRSATGRRGSRAGSRGHSRRPACHISPTSARHSRYSVNRLSQSSHTDTTTPSRTPSSRKGRPSMVIALPPRRCPRPRSSRRTRSATPPPRPTAGRPTRCAAVTPSSASPRRSGPRRARSPSRTASATPAGSGPASTIQVPGRARARPPRPHPAPPAAPLGHPHASAPARRSTTSPPATAPRCPRSPRPTASPRARSSCPGQRCASSRPPSPGLRGRAPPQAAHRQGERDGIPGPGR